MNQSRMGFGGGGFSHKAPVLATDMRCYFECPEGFKKDYDLRLHIKLRHKNEDENELRRAYQACEEEIALTQRTYSVFQCAICPKTFSEVGTFYDHVRKSHNLEWLEYKDKYGRCEVESAPFECKICGRVMKYNRDSTYTHLKKVHSITWVQYIERIRAMRRGQRPEELPNIDFFECKICSASVKFITRQKHLKGVHKITESEYLELFSEEMNKNSMKPDPEPIMPNMVNAREEDENTYPPMGMSRTPEPFPIKPMGNYTEPMIKSEQQPETSPYANLMKPPKSDIQDKTNKKCSSCKALFETRRNFIEHCTVVHNMKFRTQSGTTISSQNVVTPPRNPFQLQSQPQGGTRKRSYEGETNDGMMMQNDKSLFEQSTKRQSFGSHIEASSNFQAELPEYDEN